MSCMGKTTCEAVYLQRDSICSYAGVDRLQGVAFASSHPSTEWTACLAATSPAGRLCRPAVLLPHWTLGAEPKDLLVTF